MKFFGKEVACNNREVKNFNHSAIDSKQIEIATELSKNNPLLAQYTVEELQAVCKMIEHGNDALHEVVVILAQAAAKVLANASVDRYTPRHDTTSPAELVSLFVGGTWAGGLFLVRDLVNLTRDHMAHTQAMAALLANLANNQDYFRRTHDTIDKLILQQRDKILNLQNIIQRASRSDDNYYDLARREIEVRREQSKYVFGLTALFLLLVSGIYFQTLFREDTHLVLGGNNFNPR